MLLLGTDTDDRAAWLRVGQALGRLLLDSTSAVNAASPLTQALDWATTRTRLRGRSRLFGYPQVLLRMGYATGTDTPVVTGRRPVGDVLRIEPP